MSAARSVVRFWIAAGLFHLAVAACSALTHRTSALGDTTKLYGTWRWIETKGPLSNDCRDSTRCSRGRTLTLRADHTYAFAEHDTAFEYPLSAGRFTILGDNPRANQDLLPSTSFMMAFPRWSKWFEQVRAIGFVGADTLVVSGFPLGDAPSQWFARDSRIDARKWSRAATRVRPAAEDSSDYVEGQFVYYEDEPVPVTTPELVYPPAARAAKIEGKVVLHVLVGRDGRVKNVKIAQGVTGLNEAAMDFVRGWIFKPALANGRSVTVWVEVPVTFKL
jgi:TonB family protein